MVLVQLDRGFNQTIHQFVKICPESDFPLRVDHYSKVYKKQCFFIIKKKVEFKPFLHEIIKFKAVKPRPESYESDLLVFGIHEDERESRTEAVAGGSEVRDGDETRVDDQESGAGDAVL